MNLATIEELAYQIKKAKDKGLPKPIVFLGAGASASAGIPLTDKIVADVKLLYKNKPSVKLLINADEKNYYKIMKALTADERRDLFYDYITNKDVKINVTNIYLAQLLREGYIDFVLTVNFDDLILRACALFNFLPPVYDISNIKVPTTSNFREKSVIYLHGQHFGQWLLNSDNELGKIEKVIPNVFNEIKNRRTWIVIGYSGKDEIFNHIENLGSFTNELFWVNYLDTIPEDCVSKLIDNPDANANLIKGYDADSFMLKLNAELKLPQPLIIDKPFTSLKKTLENIVDINDKEHFKDVKKRLEIVKKDVNMAVRQFEKGIVDSNKNLKKEVDINLLKKKIIDTIIKKEFKQEDIKLLVGSANIIKNKEVNNLMANLFEEWGNAISDLAKEKNSETLYELSFEKYKKSVSLNSLNDSAYNGWADAISILAELKKDKALFEQCFEKYKTATGLNPKDDLSYNNWGGAIYNLASLEKDEMLYQQSFDKFKKATDLNSKNAFAFSNWGNALSGLAALKKDPELFLQSFEKYKKATNLNLKYEVAFHNWGISIFNLANLQNDEALYQLSIEKYKKTIELNPLNDSAYIDWGVAISDLAKLKKDEALYQLSFDKYKKATKLNTKSSFAFYSWGGAIADLAKLKNNDVLYEQSIEKFNKAIELGSSSYNLACVYAIRKNKTKALEILENSLKKKEIESLFVAGDDDWKFFLEDVDFILLLKKYKNIVKKK